MFTKFESAMISFMLQGEAMVWSEWGFDSKWRLAL